MTALLVSVWVNGGQIQTLNIELLPRKCFPKNSIFIRFYSVCTPTPAMGCLDEWSSDSSSLTPKTAMGFCKTQNSRFCDQELRFEFLINQSADKLIRN